MFNNFVLELVIPEWNPKGPWNLARAERNMQYDCPVFLATPFVNNICSAPWAQNFGGHTTCGSLTKCTSNTRYICRICDWVGRNASNTTFSIWNRTFLELRKEIVVSSETWMTHEFCHILSCSCYFPELDNHLHWRWSHEREGQAEAPPLPTSLPIHELKAHGIGGVYMK